MSDYPAGALVFLIALTVAAGFCSLALFLPLNPGEIDIPAVIMWSVIAVISESFSAYISKGNIYISTAEAVFFAAFLSGGAAAGFFCITAATLLYIKKTDTGRVHIFNKPFRLTLFNLAHYILILYVINRLYILISDYRGGQIIIPALVTAPLFFLLSCILNAVFYRLEEGRPFRAYLVEVFKPYYAEALPASFAAVVVAITYPVFGLFSVLFFITPIIVTGLSLHWRSR